MDSIKNNMSNIQDESNKGSIKRSADETTSYSISDLSAHDEIYLMKNEWEDIKELVNEIEITVPKLDTTSLLIGAALSTGITAVIQFIKDLSIKVFTLDSILYLIVTVILLSLTLFFVDKETVAKEKLNNSKNYSVVLKRKISKIDNRNSKEINQ